MSGRWARRGELDGCGPEPQQVVVGLWGACPGGGTMPERLAGMPLDLWTPLLVLWMALPPCAPAAPTGPAPVFLGGPPLDPSRLSDEQRVLNRSKRGWVWNQMFVLEEFSGPEPILVGRVSCVSKIPISGSASPS